VSRRTASSIAAVAAIESLPDKHAIAKKYDVTVRTVDRWTKDRLIPSIKLGPRCTRFEWDDVEKAVKRLTVKEVAR
jgi:hypothetical protein